MVMDRGRTRAQCPVDTAAHAEVCRLRTHLHQILLAAVHDVLGGEAVDHVAGVENNQEEDHTQEEKGLGAGSLWSYFVQLKVKKRKDETIHVL